MTQQELCGGWVRVGSRRWQYTRRGVVLSDLCEVVRWHDPLKGNVQAGHRTNHILALAHSILQNISLFDTITTGNPVPYCNICGMRRHALAT